MEIYDVVVLGAGPPGEVAAGRCADSGLSVALIEERLVGGECSFYGCIPSKTLIRPGDVLASARRVPGAAEAVGGVLDAASAFEWRDYMTSGWDDSGQLPWLQERGIKLYRGRGRLDGVRTVVVESDGGSLRLEARKAVVLACGTSPNHPKIDGLDAISYWDNRDATAASVVPRHLAVLGGGPIGVEMAQAFRRLGSEHVTVVEGGVRLLSREEPFAGEELQKAFQSEGIEVLVSTHCTKVRRKGQAGEVTLTLDSGAELVADELLVAVGRRPNTSSVGLETVGLQVGRYLPVDRSLKVEGVEGGWLYAIGDCNGLAPFTHMGKYQARVAAEAILGRPATDIADHGIVPRVIFTDPQVAAVGLKEQEARDRGLRVRVLTYPLGDVPGAYVRGKGISGTCQLVVDDERRVVIGATFTGPSVQELLHSATIAIAGEVTLDRLVHAVPSFPTVSEVWLHLLEAYGL